MDKDKFTLITGGKEEEAPAKPETPTFEANTYKITTKEGVSYEATGYFMLFGGFVSICPSYDSPLLEPLLSVPSPDVEVIIRLEKEDTAS